MADPSRCQTLSPVQAEIWAIAWPRPAFRSRPAVVIITALGLEEAWFYTNERLPVDTALELCFALPDRHVEIVCGVVIREVTPWGKVVGAFTLLACDDRDRLSTWVRDPQRALATGPTVEERSAS